MAEKEKIAAQKPKAPKQVSPEVAALLKQKAEIAERLKAISKEERAARAIARKDESAQAWSIFRYIQRNISKGEVRGLVEEVGKSLSPHDGYPHDKVESDRAALRRLLGVK